MRGDEEGVEVVTTGLVCRKLVTRHKIIADNPRISLHLNMPLPFSRLMLTKV